MFKKGYTLGEVSKKKEGNDNKKKEIIVKGKDCPFCLKQMEYSAKRCPYCNTKVKK
ncbi:MAG: hypothetical protein GY870_13270 [archaeon]|nr:hypothetical protein [archaeon]